MSKAPPCIVPTHAAAMTGRGRGGRGLGKSAHDPTQKIVPQQYLDGGLFEGTTDTVAFDADAEGYIALLEWKSPRFVVSIYSELAAFTLVTRFEFAPPPDATENLFESFRCILAHGMRMIWVLTRSRQPGHCLLLRVEYTNEGVAKVQVVIQEQNDSPAPGKKRARGGKIPDASTHMVWSHSDKLLLCIKPSKPHSIKTYNAKGKEKTYSNPEITIKGSTVRLVSLFHYAGLNWRKVGGLFVRIIDKKDPRKDDDDVHTQDLVSYFTLSLKKGAEWTSSRTPLALPELRRGMLSNDYETRLITNYQPLTIGALINITSTESVKRSALYSTRADDHMRRTEALLFRRKDAPDSERSVKLLAGPFDDDIVGPIAMSHTDVAAVASVYGSNIIVTVFRAAEFVRYLYGNELPESTSTSSSSAQPMRIETLPETATIPPPRIMSPVRAVTPPRPTKAATPPQQQQKLPVLYESPEPPSSESSDDEDEEQDYMSFMSSIEPRSSMFDRRIYSNMPRESRSAIAALLQVRALAPNNPMRQLSPDLMDTIFSFL